jgi:hypothetical protein
MKLKLRQFDIRNIKDDSVILFIGKRNTGKSFLVKDLMHNFRNLPVGVVISPTERANHFFEEFVPGMLIYDEYDPAVIKKFVERQSKITDQYSMEKKKYSRSDLDPRAFLILDDCLYDKTWPNDVNIRFLFMNGRHVKTLFMITMQYPLGIPPHLRANVDYVFILRENQITQRERIYKQYAGMFHSFEVFNQIMDATTQNYECLVIDNKVQSNKIDDQVYWYKAVDHTSFQVCSPELWDMQALEQEKQSMGGNRHEEEYDDQDYDPNLIRKNKKGSINLKVSKSY